MGFLSYLSFHHIIHSLIQTLPLEMAPGVWLGLKVRKFHTGRYHQYLLYRCLGQYRNALVSFWFKCRLYRSHFGHIGINIRFWPKNRYQMKPKKKTLENCDFSPLNFKIQLLSLNSVFPPLLCIVSTLHFFFFLFVLPTSVSSVPSSSSFISQCVIVSLFCFGTLTWM